MAGLQNCGLKLKVLQWNCNGLFAHLNEFKQHLSKNSYDAICLQEKSQTGVLHRTASGATGVQQPVTSTPVVVLPPAPRMPATDAPPARRELFQATDNTEQAETRTAADQPERLAQGGTTMTGTDSVDREARRAIYWLQNYFKQITHHFLYTLAILATAQWVIIRCSGTSCITSATDMLLGTHAGADNILGLRCFVEATEKQPVGSLLRRLKEV